MDKPLVQEKLTESVIGAFYAVYNELGFGFLEHVYVMAFERELRARGHQVARDVSVWIRYRGELLCEQRLDMIVDGVLVIEVKATAQLAKIAPRQLYNYLKATHLEVGLLLHFGPDPAFYRLFCENAPASVASEASE